MSCCMAHISDLTYLLKKSWIRATIITPDESWQEGVFKLICYSGRAVL